MAAADVAQMTRMGRLARRLRPAGASDEDAQNA
jgi:hypothetical protein